MRLKLILATNNPLLLGVDETNIANRLNYSNRPIQLSLDIYKLVRIEILTIVKSLIESDWNRIGMHNELGRITFWQYFQIACAHTEHHLYHLDLKRESWGKNKLGIQLPKEYPPTWLWEKEN